MTLSDYDPKLLNFVYELTKLKRFMSYRDISKNISIDGKTVSPKTVERWFRFLKRPLNHPGSLSKDRFDYFPNFSYEKMGLQLTYVVSDPKEPDHVLKRFPLHTYQNYALWLYDMGIHKSLLTGAYPLPLHHIDRFNSSWNRLKQEGHVREYAFYPVHSGFMIYSPWHKTIDRHGIFHPERNDESEINEQVRQFAHYLDTLPEVGLIPEIRKNPLIIPVIFEQHYKSWSSQRVWEEAKSKLGDKIWQYVRKRKEETDGYGVKRVQEAMREINKFKLFHQMKTVYIPLQLDNAFFFSIVQFRNKKELIETVRSISMASIQLTIYPMKQNQIFLIALLDHKGIKRFFDVVEDVPVKRILLSQHEKSLPLLSDDKGIVKFNYASLFNSNALRWR